MKKTFALPFIIAFTIIALVIGFSCRKKAEAEPEPTPTPTGSTSNINGFFTSNATPALTFTVSVAITQTITGTKTIIKIPANAFVTKSTGSPITGTVQITLKEIFTKKDMILNKAQTMASTDLLISGGEIDIKVKQGTTDLKLGPGKQLDISMQAPAVPSFSMQLFFGAINATQQLNWALNTTSATVNTAWDSTALGTGYYYTFNCDSLNWINCDMFYNVNPKTSFTVTLNGVHSATNTTVFIAFPSINGVSHLYAGGTSQTFSHYSQIPVGINATIVAISEISGQHYSAFVPATITTGFTTAVTLTATTNSAILTQLNSL